MANRKQIAMGPYDPANYTPEQLQGQSDFAKDPYQYYTSRGMAPEHAQRSVQHNQESQASIDKAIKGNWLDKLMEWGPFLAFGGAMAAPAIAGAFGGSGAAAGGAAGAGGAGAGASVPALSSLPFTAGATVPTVGGVSSLVAPAAASSALGGTSTAGLTMGGGSGASSGAGSTAATTAAKTGANVAGKTGFSGFMNSPFGLNLLGSGLDILGGLIGGDDEQSSGRDDLIRSFMKVDPNSPQGKLINPQNALYNALQAVIAMQKDVAGRPFIQPRPISAAPPPRNIPGTPFPIGGSVPQGPVGRTYQPPSNSNILELLNSLSGGGGGAAVPRTDPSRVPNPTTRRNPFRRNE